MRTKQYRREKREFSPTHVPCLKNNYVVNCYYYT